VALLPTGLAIAGLALILVGTVVIVRLRAFPKAYGLGVLSMAVFALQLADPFVTLQLGLRSEAFLSGATWWAPLTYMFVHADPFHLVGNLFILLTAGAALEDRLGERTFFVVYFAAGFAAALGHLGMAEILPRIVSPFSLAVGASGAIFGVLTTYAVLFPRKNLPILLGIMVFWFPSFGVLLIYLGFNVAYMFAQTGIAWWGHFSGFLVGLAAAFAFQNRLRAPTTPLATDAALAALATTPETKEILAKIETFTGTAADDATFRDAWVEKLVRKARCPSGHALAREKSTVRCAGGEFELDLAKG